MLMQADIILLPISICHFDLPQQWTVGANEGRSLPRNGEGCWWHSFR